MKYRIIISLLCLAGWMVLGGCTEPNSSGDSGNVKISVRGSSRNSPQGLMLLAKRGGAVSSVTITQAQVVIDRIEFKNTNEEYDALDDQIVDRTIYFGTDNSAPVSLLNQTIEDSELSDAMDESPIIIDLGPGGIPTYVSMKGDVIISGNGDTIISDTTGTLAVQSGQPASMSLVDVLAKPNATYEDSIGFTLNMPFVQDLVGDSMYVIAVVDLPIGTYEEMEIEIDELESEDGAAYAQNPNLQDLSIYVAGYVNGDTTQKFIFVSDLSEEQEKEFDLPLVIDAASPDTNVVLTIDTSMWFVDDDGNFIDPRLPGNQRVIEKNIKKSIEMYEDENDDGEDDDGD